MLKAKRSIAIAVCMVVFLFSFSTGRVVKAEQQPGTMSISWVTLQSISLGLIYDDDTDTVYWGGILQGNSSTHSMTATFRLYKLISGQYVQVAESPFQSSTSMVLSYEGAYSPATTGTYKVTVNGAIMNTSGQVEFFDNSFVKTFP
ncbi:MAG: hypothetical protein LBM93_13150 [Oscillospiraceae bacterium]|jgi:hypothetical protein|nr:hypothetical protein [Oscillospiraceae bacterium]